MQRYLIEFEYDGTGFSGYQTQEGMITIQSELEKALSEALGEKIDLIASGRTDAGVSAYAQTGHFDSDTIIPESKIPLAVNVKLQETIKIINCKKVSNDFHARRSVKRKTYVYKIWNSKIASPIRRNSHYHFKFDLNVAKMCAACKFFEGEHDFVGFMASNSGAKTTVRKIEKIAIISEGNEIEIKVTGKGFLYNMVRIIVGTLLNVGTGKIAPEAIENILLSKNRELAGMTVPAVGLYLQSVEY